jgi:hypothetical protein
LLLDSGSLDSEVLLEVYAIAVANDSRSGRLKDSSWGRHDVEYRSKRIEICHRLSLISTEEQA